MGKKNKKKKVLSCACGFSRTTLHGKIDHCPICGTKIKKRKIFTEDTRSAFFTPTKDHKSRFKTAYQEPEEKHIPEPPTVAETVMANYDVLKQFVATGGRVEFSDGYFGNDVFGDDRRAMVDAYVKSMKNRKRLLLFEYEPREYQTSDYMRKASNPYENDQAAVSFNIKLTNDTILSACAENWGAVGGTRGQAVVYEQNRMQIMLPKESVEQKETNADRCLKSRDHSIYPDELVQSLYAGAKEIKRLLNEGTLRWCRFGELALFTKGTPNIEIEALTIHGAIRYMTSDIPPVTGVVRVRFSNGCASILSQNPKIANLKYMMGLSDMCAWAYQICYVYTPLVKESDILKLELKNTTNELKSLADYSGIPVITAQQLNQNAASETDASIQTKNEETTTSNNIERVWNYITTHDCSDAAVAGLMGDMYVKSTRDSTNLQNCKELPAGILQCKNCKTELDQCASMKDLVFTPGLGHNIKTVLI